MPRWVAFLLLFPCLPVSAARSYIRIPGGEVLLMHHYGCETPKSPTATLWGSISQIDYVDRRLLSSEMACWEYRGGRIRVYSVESDAVFDFDESEEVIEHGPERPESHPGGTSNPVRLWRPPASVRGAPSAS